jgi:predicted kinase
VPTPTSPTLYVTRGLPGSGKSTWARLWVAHNPAWRARTNRDCLRDMLWTGAYRRCGEFEDVVTAVQHAQVRALLTDVDVVSDDTNLNPAVMELWAWLAASVGARLEVVDLTGVPVETCVERDATRPVLPGRCDGARVGEAVIRDLAGRYLGVGGMVTA